jgi:RHS repeat-associated protein
MLFFALGQSALAQMTISGNTCGTAGQSSTYSVSSSYTSGYPTQWQVTGGLITGTSSNSQNGTGLSSISVTWNSGTSVGTVNVHVYSSANPSASLNVNVGAALVPGAITANATQTVYKTVPATISCSAATYGGCSPITYNYQWQQSTDQASWTDVAGATGQNLSFSAVPAAQSIYYRRYVVSNAYQSGYSGTALVNVLPALNGGNASPASQDILTGTAPAALSSSTATGGNCGGSYTYQWMNSSNGTAFYAISGATGASYSPPALTQTMYYQRMVTCGSESVYSTTATVNVYPHLAAGTISSSGSSINYGTAPGTISTTAATGGLCGGSYSYQWQVSTNGNVSFADIAGATGLSYTPGTLTATTGYRCKVTCNTETVYTGNYTATVYAQLAAGTISPATQSINYNTAATLTGTAATGGNGTYTYQWQSSPDNSTWTNITGAISAGYTSGSLTTTTYFRRTASSNGVSVNSSAATVTVYPQLVSGTTSPASQNINYNTAAATLTSTAATGGSGTYTYQWQSSPNNSTWTNITSATTLSYAPGTLTATTYYHLVSTSNGGSVTGSTATVTVYPQLASGTVSPANQNINYSTAAATVTSTAATGGSGTYTYQWQSSVDNSTWTNIAGATTLSYAPGTLTTTMYYHLVSSSNGVSVTSGTATVTVFPQLVSGTVSPASQAINYNTAAATLTGTAATGGNGTYTYQWQSSPNNSTWTNVAGATSLSYAPGARTATTYFHLVSTSNGISVSSGSATVTVYPQLVSGTVSPAGQSINYNTAAATLTYTAATGGNSTYTYQWQSSPNNSTWTNITGATALSYAPGTLTASMYYHVVASSNGVSVTGGTATVTVYPQLAAGAVSPATQTVLTGTAAAALSCAPSGGSGTYTYQWQSSPDNSTWANIGSATGSSYSPGILTVNTYYRVGVTSNGVSAYTTSAVINVTNCQVMNTNPGINMNYIVTSVLRIPGVTSISGLSQLAAMTTCDVNQVITYLDGLGRPVQTVQVKGSPARKDIVQPIAYDQYGHEAQKYLPYALKAGTSDGSYKTDALTAGAGQADFYTAPPTGVRAVSNPYAVTGFEPSPLNRVAEQGASGADWQPYDAGITNSGHTTKIAYVNNNALALTDTANSTLVALYATTINADRSQTLTRATGTNANYTAGTLYITVSKDENWKSGRGGTTEEYKDNAGHVVLKRTFNYSGTTLQILSTYYVYDDLGNLAFVLPPLAGPDMVSGVPSATIQDNLCYQYRYDERNRLIQKKIPGKGWEYMVYNKLDQLVLNQDAVQRLTNQWTVTKYDGLSRVIITGLWNAGALIAQSTLQNSIYASAQWDSRDNTNNTTTYPIGYVLSSYPALNKILTVNYYDAYTNIPGIPAAFVVTGNSAMTKGLLTATKTAVLNTIGNTTPDMLWTAHYYDDRGRSTKTFQQHYLGGVLNAGNYDVANSTYNFNDQVTTNTRQHFTSASTSVAKVTISNRYIYDHMGRKLKTWEQIQNGGQLADTRTLVSQTDYNEIGQVWKKNLHSTDSTTFMQTVAYTYNERGWLLTSSAPLFATQLYYNTGTYKQYNGNIAYQYWGVPGNLSSHYNYVYDQLNRLNGGNSTAGNNENSISYDAMGNIKALKRYAANTLIDQLTYTYAANSNQLLSVTDATTNDAGQKQGTANYLYDVNGNLVADDSKGITGTTGITYNLLNQPQAIASKGITYTYDATGQKLRRVTGTAATDYIGGIQYEASTSAVSFIKTEEGRVLPNGATAYNYEYSLTDHLGNSRVNFDTGTGAVRQVQTDDYYPFGMDIASGTRLSPPNNYLYNKKELQTDLGLYDYGARFYDPVIARWATVDPLAEEGKRWSPYAYCYNDPIGKVDLDGMIPWPLRGYIAVNKKDYANGGYGLVNTIVRTSTYLEIRNVGTSPHVGIDYRAKVGTPFYSLGDGVVSSIGEIKNGKAKGAKFIEVKYKNGDKVRFLHLSSVAKDLKEGTHVYEGQELGKTGDTGAAFAHLHVDAKNKDGERIDPENQNYGTVSNEEFFTKYDGDYKNLPTYSGDDSNDSDTNPATAPIEIQRILYYIKLKEKMKDIERQYEWIKNYIDPKKNEKNDKNDK